ncbi:MAG: hypothetical protein GY950_26610 [bacterium]|nr:hypothetical protein [bacterium]
MAKKIYITIENKLLVEKRDMNVFHHSTRSAHMISYDSSITLPLKAVSDDDYLHISIVSGPGYLESMCVVNLPSWLDFELSSATDATVTHSGDRTLVKIPPGPPTWQLKMTRSYSSVIHQPAGRVIIGDEQFDFLTT